MPGRSMGLVVERKHKRVREDPHIEELVKKLSPRKQVFFYEYLVDFDTKRAARAAGYKSESATSKLLSPKYNPVLCEAIDRALEVRKDKYRLTAERVLEELGYCALRDPIDLCDENGLIRIDDLRKLPAAVRRTIESIKCKQHYGQEGNVEGQTIELKLVNKHASLELAMKHLGLLSEDRQRDINNRAQLDWDSMVKPVGPEEA